MKFDMIRLVGGSQNVDLPIIGADGTGPFVFMGADGLGPSEINVLMAEGVLERAIYQGKKAVRKQPVIRIGLNPDWNVGQTPEELRTVLYSLLTPRYGAMLEMQVFYQGAKIAIMQGQISRMEATIFAADPVVQVTMETDYAYLQAPTFVIGQPATRAQGTGYRAWDVTNTGTAPSGFKAAFAVSRSTPLSTFILRDVNPLGQFLKVENVVVENGDNIIVNTIPGQRGIFQAKAGSSGYFSILNGLTTDSQWITLHEGLNTLMATTDALAWNVPEGSFRYLPQYWGL